MKSLEMTQLQLFEKPQLTSSCEKHNSDLKQNLTGDVKTRAKPHNEKKIAAKWPNYKEIHAPNLVYG